MNRFITEFIKIFVTLSYQFIFGILGMSMI